MTDPVVPEPSSELSTWWSDRLDRLRASLPSPPPRTAVVAGVAFGVVVVVVVAVVFLHRSSGRPPLVLPRAGAGAAAGAQPTTGADQAPSGTGAGAPDTVTVYAAGAVARPGIYVVPGRARVADVVAAAGGTIAEANLDQLNLAAKVTDAERIYVPRKGEAAAALANPLAGGSPSSPAAGPGPAGPIDLNSADATQLDVLPGVGPTTAKAIVAYRNVHGRFRSVTDLLAVPGIGPAKLDAIRPLVTVTPG